VLFSDICNYIIKLFFKLRYAVTTGRLKLIFVTLSVASHPYKHTYDVY